jgi:hypothetical protein
MKQYLRRRFDHPGAVDVAGLSGDVIRSGRMFPITERKSLSLTTHSSGDNPITI